MCESEIERERDREREGTSSIEFWAECLKLVMTATVKTTP